MLESFQSDEIGSEKVCGTPLTSELNHHVKERSNRNDRRKYETGMGEKRKTAAKEANVQGFLVTE